jgi:DNA-binding response OmpR family regulator
MYFPPGRSRLRALSRNRIQRIRDVAPLRVGDLEIDALHRRITQGKREIRLSPNEHAVLYTLAANRGTVVRYQAIADALGIGPEVRTNTVARHVTSLRRKLGDTVGRPRYVETLTGVGYRFVVLVEI